MSLPSNDPLIQQLQLLLTGYGYNFYDQKNQMRADDLLVREKATNSLGQAASLLAQLSIDYQARCIPPSTREHPYPTAQEMGRLNAIRNLQELISGLASRIRGMSVPTQDRIWWRFRDETNLLRQLLTFDIGLINDAEDIYRRVRALQAEMWNEGVASELQATVQRLNDIARDRERFLMVPIP